MICTGCRITIAYAQSWQDAQGRTIPASAFPEYQGQVIWWPGEGIGGGDGSCEPQSEGSNVCVPATACVFYGMLQLFHGAANTARLDIVVRTMPGISGDAEEQWNSHVGKGSGTSYDSVKVWIGGGLPGGSNESSCEGLINPIEDASNGYVIRLYEEKPGSGRPPVTRDDKGKPTVDGECVMLAYLYCELCDQLPNELAKLHNPNAMSATEIVLADDAPPV